ncbi:hypothetical protein CV83915_03554 [Escherichia coli]|uniref:HAD hydrolase YfhB n=1 Tax=Escherichia coli TaxID=562 RepID=A0A2H4TWG3_ECOLX|nr:hypothetical protein CV83915_03554 [Escherichia coli]
MATHERRVVFFDLDGTLHQQDMFGSFLRYLLRRQPLNALLVLPLLPIIAIVDSIGQRNSYVKTWGCGGFLNETNIYSRGKSLCF